jgi:2-desacetyl-2-hydroxyethyl bacteriochlorophyllide A dehydrogenase
MRRAMLYAPHDLRLENVEEPALRTGEVLVRIHACGVCGSDLHLYAGHDPWNSAGPGPRCLGHETAGVVERVAPSVTKVAPGDSVAVEPMFLRACRLCDQCRRGASNRCDRRGFWHGQRSGVGGFADLEAVAESNVHPLAEGLDLETAAFADVYACALHALRRDQVKHAGTLLVIGSGALGVAVCQMAKALGVPRVVLAGRRPEPLRVAYESGAADAVVHGDAAKVAKAIGPGGADLVVEAVGGDGSTMDMALELAGRGGVICILGAFWRPVQIDYSRANAKELSVVFSSAYSQTGTDPEFPAALRMLAARKVAAHPLITHRYPLERIGEAFEVSSTKRTSGAIRVLINPAG